MLAHKRDYLTRPQMGRGVVPLPAIAAEHLDSLQL